MRPDKVLTLGLLTQLERFQRELRKWDEVGGPIGSVHQSVCDICDEALQSSNQAASDEPDTLWSDEELKRFIIVIQAGFDLLANMLYRPEPEPAHIDPSPLESSADAAGEWSIDAQIAERYGKE